MKVGSNKRDEEVTVIDEETLYEVFKDSMEREGAVETEDDAAVLLTPPHTKNEQILVRKMSEATDLLLSFRNIMKIDNLQGFNSLLKLCLDNNAISEIQNLDHLEHLEWLDLSFNSISKIEGLSKLTNLKDVTFFANKIEEICGLDACTNLECLSLGNNKISSVAGVIELRRFKGLRLLNLEGNPVSEGKDYRLNLIAFMNQLKYLDYIMVTTPEVEAAKEQFQDDLMDVMEDDALDDERLSREAAEAEYSAKLARANLGVFETMFKDMFAGDDSHPKLREVLPGVDDLVATFSSELEAMTQTMLQICLSKDEDRRAELEMFQEALAGLRGKFTSESIDIIEKWNASKLNLSCKLSIQTSVHAEDLAGPLRKVDDLYSKLMDLELRQVQYFEDIMSDFEARYREMTVACGEVQQSYFKAVEECENNYYKALNDLAESMLEKAAAQDEDDENSEVFPDMLLDRDLCMETLSASHDAHVGKVFKGEDVTRSAETQKLNSTIDGLMDEEHERNRSRIMELHEFSKAAKAELNSFITKEEIDEDYDD
uniref:Dynein regulatory complex subunit 3 n=1 Tax=Octactis speculum TaxID=3111310 RepID=A0A7S2HFX7_9STRA|mmetsp:Transcript_64536/g.88659  ORF Transcript_64536/g.88659 Transcript_64536/m.88659 type:complete len:543 (+) Transcript_64536:77-1705(+)|eukprot:CAMPEP_0185772448 /NCGR_PEP_ID=MMETSP1174-20130828/69125_1 /TAXON_ID=35687 /ORGANISM="Dictyocha speculum, Strain CCMP1381" /LENGTH=542 /DNA_ID=CAMNT_0028458735 /DNA_START=77 /DNA_END=1705 /DNA_ORIENTATION=+